jgi:hypothetical protein
MMNSRPISLVTTVSKKTKKKNRYIYTHTHAHRVTIKETDTFNVVLK